MNANCEINYLCIALAMLSFLSHLSVKTGTTFVTFPLGLYPEDREMHSVVHCCANLVRAHHMFSQILNLRIYKFFNVRSGSPANCQNPDSPETGLLKIEKKI